MNGRPPERWVLILDVRDDGAPPAVTVKRLLKMLWRSWGIRCTGYAEDQRLAEQQAEIEKLQKIIDGLAARVAGQADLGGLLRCTV